MIHAVLMEEEGSLYTLSHSLFSALFLHFLLSPPLFSVHRQIFENNLLKPEILARRVIGGVM